MIGENIKKFREEAGMTQSELASKVFVNQSMIAQIERGSKVPTLPLARAIAEALGVSINQL